MREDKERGTKSGTLDGRSLYHSSRNYSMGALFVSGMLMLIVSGALTVANTYATDAQCQLNTLQGDIAMAREEIAVLNDRVSTLEADIQSAAFRDPRQAQTIPATYKTEVAPKLVEPSTYKISFYCSCEKCCGKSDGITASGSKVKAGRTVAAPKTMPFGTRINIEGIGERVVEDRGGSIKGNRIDVYVESHAEALKLGTFNALVEVR